MAKMVGFSRKLRLQWLDRAAESAAEGADAEKAKYLLNEYLKFEIESPTTLRKTREILIRLWIAEDNEPAKRLREEGLSIIREHPEYAPIVHWCVILATYPVFADLCKIIGNLAEFQGEITTGQIRSKLFDEWGERTTLLYTVEKEISSLKDWGILESVRQGKYQIVQGAAADERVSAFMAYALMLAVPRAYYSLSDLNRSPYFFPFPYKVGREILQEDSRFSLNYFGDELSVALRS